MCVRTDLNHKGDAGLIHKYYDVDAPKRPHKCRSCRQYVPGGYNCPCSRHPPRYIFEIREYIEDFMNKYGICPGCHSLVAWGYRCHCMRLN